LLNLVAPLLPCHATPRTTLQSVMHGQAFSQCTACSPAVVGAYQSRGVELVEAAVAEPASLEALTGLDRLHAESAAMWAEDEGGADGGAAEGSGDGDDWTEL